jgi:hypothetical protein
MGIYEIYDTNGIKRLVTTDMDLEDLRARLSQFRTHCAVEKKAYEVNHFINWLNKNFEGVTRQIDLKTFGRIDM